MKEIKILLINDDFEYAKTLAKQLKKQDLNADTVYNGDYALSYVAQKEPDVILIEIKNSNCQGLELFQKIKKKHPDLQVITLMENHTEKDMEEAKKLGSFYIMKKTADIEILSSIIKLAYEEKKDFQD
jgi:DNA-binding NtrC family response regulator